MAKQGKGSAESRSLRVAPHNIEAEQAVLGGFMLDPRALVKVSDWLSPADFYRRDHRAIYLAILDVAARGIAYDAVTLGEYIQREGLADLVGGVGYIIELANTTPSAANIVAYADIVKEKSKLRQLIDAGTEAASAGFEPKGKSAEMIATEFAHAVAQISSTNARGGPISVRDALRSFFADTHRLYEINDEVTGMRSPWPNLDHLTQGFQDASLEVFAGRPSMGKSIVGLNIVEHASIVQGIRGGVWSLEMSEIQLVRRMVSSRSGIPHKWLRAPTKQPEDEVYWPQVSEAMEAIGRADIVFDTQAGLTMAQICARAEREHIKKPLKYVLIDHLHIIDLPGKENTSTKIGHATRRAKQLAKDLNVPVFLLAQLNRGNTQRQDKRPTMADLRESGAIEQDADNVYLLHREEYYDRNTHFKGVVEIEIGKGRDVEAGKVAFLENESQYMRFRNWEGPLPLPKPSVDGKPFARGLKKERGKRAANGAINADDERRADEQADAFARA